MTDAQAVNCQIQAPLDITQAELDLVELFATAILFERRHAHAKHGATSMEQSGVLEHRRASILVEEAVECGRALNDHEHGTVELQDLAGKRMAGADVLDKELIQTGTMAFTWWANRRGQVLPAPPEPYKLPIPVIEFLDSLSQGIVATEDARRVAREILGR